MDASERQKHGRCFADMVLQGVSNVQALSSHKVYRHTYILKRRTLADGSLLNGHLNVGDPITVSVEPNLLVVARGAILKLNSESIVLGVDRQIDPKKLRSHASTFDAVIFRIDKDEMLAGMARIRDNLAQLFFARGDAKRLSLVVDLREPVFRSNCDLKTQTSSLLNRQQNLAVKKVLLAEDYCLILGMPGTGKTTTIAETIKILVSNGSTVLLASYTHSAVDTILMKLLNAESSILRIGNADKVNSNMFLVACRLTVID